MIRPLLHSGPAPEGAVDFGFTWGVNGLDSGQAVLLPPRAALQAVCGLSMDRPRIMGILNVTPDSFSDGGQHNDLGSAIARGQEMAAEVDIIDIGGESTRPGAKEVPEAEEIGRTAPVIRALRDAGVTTPISIDTRKAAVAEAALTAGASMVNDVSALRFDPDLAGVTAKAEVPICLMHAQGLPDTMQDNPSYGDVVAEVYDHLVERVAFAKGKGINQIVADPGIGFGKTQDHNLALLAELAQFHMLGLPLLLGVSRKRFIGAIGGVDDPQDRMPGSVAVGLYGLSQGVHILRVHDTAATKQAVRLWWAAAKGKSI